MKRFFTLVFFAPLFLLSQSPLVKWYKKDLTPTVLDRNISAEPIKGITNIEWGTENVFFSTDDNISTSASPDPTKYVEFSFAPHDLLKIELSAFEFAVRAQGGEGQKFQLKFSKKADFSSAATLLEETTTTSYKNYNVNFPANTVVNTGEKLYVRLFVYNTNNNLHIQHNNSGTIAPVFYGKVSQMVATPAVAHDDRTATKKDTPVKVNILSNDEFIGPLQSINITKLPKGTVTVNGTADVTYAPKPGFVGYDSFYYMLTNSAGASNEAKVEVQVIDGQEVVLSRWNKADFSPVNYIPGVSGASIKASANIAINNFTPHWIEEKSYSSYQLTGFPINSQFDGNMDDNRYFEFSLGSALAQEMVMLNKFAMQYAGHSTGSFTIKYSKDPGFKKDVAVLVQRHDFSETAYTSWNDFSVRFPNGATLLPGEKIYVRIYIYNLGYAAAGFYIKYAENFAPNLIVGPTISGFKSLIYPEPCSETVTWGASGWENGRTPSLEKRVLITADYDFAKEGDFEACSVDVRNAKLVVPEGHTLNVDKEVIVENGASLTIKSGGTLFQQDDRAKNIGAVTVERATKLKRLDYVYWASPVAGQNLKAFSPGTLDNRFLTYNEATDLFDGINPKTHNFGNNTAGFESAAKGYAIRAYNNYPVATSSTPAPEQDFTGKFTGVPNNGRVEFSLKYKSGTNAAGNGYNLVGNPYPSNISFDALVKLNEDVLSGPAYFWTNLNPNPEMQGSGYPGEGYFNNYAVLNRVGGIPATLAETTTIVQPHRTIAVGQGFIVKAAKAGTLVFNNTVRVPDTESNFVNRNTKQTDRFWLHMKTPIGVLTTALIGYMEKATDGYEEMYDARLLTVGSDALFTEVEGRALGIQGRAWPLVDTDVVELGTAHHAPGMYTLSLGDHEGIFATDQEVFVRDQQTGIVTNLTQGDYSFAAEAGRTSGRFQILYRRPQVLSTSAVVSEDLVVYRQGEDFVVKVKSGKVEKIELYDASGRLLRQLRPGTQEIQLEGSSLSSGMYLLHITYNGKTVHKKILK